MANIVLKNICKTYDKKQVVKNLNLEIGDGEFAVLVGPSGCGKSTTLRMIAGLEAPTEGEIYIDGKLVNDVPAGMRDIAMVFQNYAIYPTMTVRGNIEFGLKNRRSKQPRKRKSNPPHLLQKPCPAKRRRLLPSRPQLSSAKGSCFGIRRSKRRR